MARPSPIALCSAMPLDEEPAADGGVPEWIHLLPSGKIGTQDGRGPYTVASMAALADQLNAGKKLAIDECHATDLAAPQGAPAPARGWMSSFEARADGLWAKVKWTGQGRALMADEQYNGISPVILHSKDNAVVGVLRASLTNAPNLKGLTALHAETLAETTQNEGSTMDWKMKLIEWLGLDGEADDAAIETALKAKLAAADKPAMQSQQFDITTAPAFIALQGELATTVTALNAQTEANSRKEATAFVDGAIGEGRVGVKAARDEYITMHMENPDRARKLVGAMPMLKGAAIQSETPAAVADETGLDAGDRQVMALMGLNETEYQKSQQASGAKKEAL